MELFNRLPKRQTHVHQLTLSRLRYRWLPVCPSTIPRRSGDLPHRTTTRTPTLLAVRLRRRLETRVPGTHVPHTPDRPQAYLRHPGCCSCLVPGLRWRSPGESRFCRPQETLHPFFRALRLGVVPDRKSVV